MVWSLYLVGGDLHASLTAEVEQDATPFSQEMFGFRVVMTESRQEGALGREMSP